MGHASEPRGLAMTAVILCGGLGTRLQQVLGDRPKAMAPIRGHPFLEWLLVALQSEGFGRVVLATGYRSEAIEGYFGDGSFLGLTITYSRDPEPMGTGGALRRGLGLVDERRLLVLNGDSLCRFSIAELTSYHSLHGADATLLVTRAPDPGRFGQVMVAADGRVTSFDEKQPGNAGLVSAGIYLFERSVVEEIPAHQKVSLEREVLPRLSSGRLFALEAPGPLVDIGTPESLADADRALAADLARLERLRR